MLHKYPTPKDWRNVRFLDEVHLGYGLSGRIYVTRCSSEVTCPDYMQLENESKPVDEKKVHAWVAVGYGYKSLLYFYDAGNSNGAMTIETYLPLLKEEVGTWLKHWVLEEDGAKGHGRGKNSPITKWKDANGISYYFNHPYSPDLALIENCWIAPKSYLRKSGYYIDEMVKEIALEGWDALKEKKINAWCDSMPQRLRDVIAMKGQLTGW